MDLRNKIGLYGSYFLCMAGIGFILPYLPLYLHQQGLSESAIGFVWTAAALAGLLQFPLGVWSDRLRARKPFLLGALAVLTVVTLLLHGASGALGLGVLAVLFAENGPCRATVESLAGAEAVHLAPPSQVGAALGALRFWRPIGIMAVALVGGALVEHNFTLGSILLLLVGVQGLAFIAALLIHDEGRAGSRQRPEWLPRGADATPLANGHPWRDGSLWVFVAAMVLFHAAAAPGGAYLGLFVKQDLGASDGFLPYLFIVMMVAWMALVRPAGRWADRIGRKPLLVVGWSAMTIRLALLAVAKSPEQILFIQLLDGLAQGMFGVLAAAWVTDRFADPRRAGEAQVLVGSCLVLGSALGPLLAGLVVQELGYRGLFALLASIAGTATLLVLFGVPETLSSVLRSEFQVLSADAGNEELRTPNSELRTQDGRTIAERRV
ncbi:MAG TPA: MFS transporter [Gemmataceae bacterium]|nr:MFS transporter [Gemmataceae bacterium]